MGYQKTCGTFFDQYQTALSSLHQGIAEYIMVAKVNLFSLLAKHAKVQRIYVGYLQAFEEMIKALDTLQINPVIDTVYNLKMPLQHLSIYQKDL